MADDVASVYASARLRMCFPLLQLLHVTRHEYSGVTFAGFYATLKGAYSSQWSRRIVYRARDEGLVTIVQGGKGRGSKSIITLTPVGAEFCARIFERSSSHERS